MKLKRIISFLSALAVVTSASMATLSTSYAKGTAEITAAESPFVVAGERNIVNSGECGANLKWTLDDQGLLVISGQGDMKSTNKGLFSNYRVRYVIIQEGVTSIGNFAFIYCNGIIGIEIPDSVKTVGTGAFMGCSSLKEVKIPTGVTAIGDSTFYFCESLSTLHIPNTVTKIGNNAFSSSYNINNVYYDGTEAEWESIRVGTGNDPLYYGTVNFKSEEAVVTTVAITTAKPATTVKATTSKPATTANSTTTKAITTSATTASEVLLIGDANCDGKITLADSTAILQSIANPDKYGLSQQGSVNGDVDGKKGISSADAIEIKKYFANVITEFVVSK